MIPIVTAHDLGSMPSQRLRRWPVGSLPRPLFVTKPLQIREPRGYFSLSGVPACCARDALIAGISPRIWPRPLISSQLSRFPITPCPPCTPTARRTQTPSFSRILTNDRNAHEHGKHAAPRTAWDKRGQSEHKPWGNMVNNADYSVVQSQKASSAHFESKQIMPSELCRTVLCGAFE